MKDRAKKIAEYIKSQSRVEIVTHQDADGLAAGSIARSALEREGIEFKISVLKQLDNKFIDSLEDTTGTVFWFTDLGSGNLDLLKDLDVVITDHHELQAGNVELPAEARTDLMELSKIIHEGNSEFRYHLNPHLFNRDGALDISGAGVTYMVAEEMRSKNSDLSSLAIIGAVGDLQDAQYGRLIGMNRKILEVAEKAGVISSKMDIRFFGRETRPLHRFLMYASEPSIPGLTRDEQACITFFKDLGVPVRRGEEFRCWVDLNNGERKKILSELSLILVNNGFDHTIIDKLIGEVYTLPREKQGTELHDAKEFATLLNSCGRYQAADIGIRVCLGDRKDAFVAARNLLKGHRSNLVANLKVVQDIGIKRMDGLQYFHAEDKISENIIGTIAGMVLNSGNVERSIPLLAFANCDDGINIKASIRASSKLTDAGLNLSDMIRSVAEGLGGIGGGHNIAAGATIPRGTEPEFIKKMNELLVEWKASLG